MSGQKPEFDFQPYLRAIATHYAQECDRYTPTDALLPLEVRSVERREQEGREQPEGRERPEGREKPMEQFPVLVGLRKYAIGEGREHVLLAGRPGSGKSMALRQLVVELAEEGLVPVLVQLKGNRPVLEAIANELERGNLELEPKQIKRLLRQNQLVLLLDGVNEIPTELLRRQLQEFRETYPQTPMIFTTRDLSLGGDLGIEKRFEMQPLSPKQLKEFVGKYLGDKGDRLLGQLRDRLREIAETPLLLKMLCDVLDPETGKIPESKGELFRWFDRDYERIKKGVEYVPVSENFWLFKAQILQHLAFATIKADWKEKTEPAYTFSRDRAVTILENWLRDRGMTDAPTKAALSIKDLVNYHLLQDAAEPGEIEFHHQLFQEYYAAEALLGMFRDLSDEQLKQDYLNYLKWTEPVALMLALVDDEALAVRVVEQALAVDLMLGARLAGAVKAKFQTITVRQITELKLQTWINIKLLQETASFAAIPTLLKVIDGSESSMRHRAVRALGNVGTEPAILGLLEAIGDLDPYVRCSAAEGLGTIAAETTVSVLSRALEDSDLFVQESAAKALAMIGSEEAISSLLKALGNLNNAAAHVLGELRCESAVPLLIKVIKDSLDPWTSRYAADALGKIGFEINANEIIQDLLKLMDCPFDSSFHWNRRRIVFESLKAIRFSNEVPFLLNEIKNEDPIIRWKVVGIAGAIGSDSVLADLLEALKDTDLDVQRRAAIMLGKIGSDKVVPDLLEMLQHSDLDIRCRAIEVLGAINSDRSISALFTALQDSEPDVRLRAVVALGMTPLDKLNPSLINILGDSNAKYLVDQLSKIETDIAIPGLIKAIDYSDSEVRKRAVKALGKIGAETAIVKLLKVIEDADNSVRISAANALGQMGSGVGISVLLGEIEDSDSWARHHAEEALCDIAKKHVHTMVLHLPHLLTLISTDAGEHAHRAIQVIQANCKFYNYEIHQKAQTRAASANPPPPPASTIYNINTVGNLNTGTVHIQGDQIGEQTP